MIGNELKIYVEEIGLSLYQAKRYYNIFSVLGEKKTRTKYMPIIDKYEECMDALKRAAMNSSIIDLYKVIEERRDTHNIYQLIKRLKKTKLSTSASGYESDLSAHFKTIQGIRNIRNEVVGHNSTKPYEETFKDADITYNQWTQLIDKLIFIINDIQKNLGHQEDVGLFADEAAKEMELLLQDLMVFHTDKEETAS